MIFTDDFGTIIVNLHKNCIAEYCVIHNQSDHHMRGFKLLWRPDRQMFERICEHGIGHPDPDHLTSKRALVDGDSVWAEGVHGCDGCCREEN